MNAINGIDQRILPYSEGRRNRLSPLVAGGRRRLACSAYGLLLLTAFAAHAQDQPGPPSGNGVQPAVVAGNPTCAQLPGADPDWIEFRVEAPSSGSYDDGTLEVTLQFTATGDGELFDWQTSLGVAAVYVKGGSNGNLFKYDPPAPETADTDLHSPINSNNDKYYDVSHINFCYDPDQQGEPASITVVKNTVGGDGSFDFTSDIPGNTTFGITTSGNAGQHGPITVDPGTFAISESVPAGWSLTAASCSNNDAPEAVTVGSGESVTCTFTNTLDAPDPGSITIVKQSGANDGTFPYSGDLGAFALTTSGGTDSRTFGDLAAGLYDVTEAVPDGWTLAGLQCDDGSNVGNATAHIDLAAGEDVTCTFTNRLIPPPPGTITIVKVSLNGDRVFDFSGTLGAFGITTVDGSGSRVFEDLGPGTYDVTEAAPKGWKLDSIECSDGAAIDLGAGTAHIALAQGEGVLCTFTNSRTDGPPNPTGNAAITIIKQSTGGNGEFSYSGDLQAFEITTVGGNGSKVFGNIAPGTYAVKETAVKGWKLKSISCSNQSSTADLSTATATVVALAQEQVTCTFVNQQLGEPVPSLPQTAFFGLLALLASVGMWTLRRMHG